MKKILIVDQHSLLGACPTDFFFCARTANNAGCVAAAGCDAISFFSSLEVPFL